MPFDEPLRQFGLDVRHACRRLLRSPGFALTAIATLALAIGASTTMFGVLDAVALRALPFPDPDRLVMVWIERPADGVRDGRSAYRNADTWRAEGRSLDALAVLDPVVLTSRNGAGMERISGNRVSPGIFPMLGVTPIRGRLFTDADAAQQRRVAVISHRFWMARFNGSADAIGALLPLDAGVAEIVGVLPPTLARAGFGADVWEPHTSFADWATLRAAVGNGGWFVIAKLRSGSTMAAAERELDAINRRLEAGQPAGASGRRVRLSPLREFIVGAGPRQLSWLLSGAVLVLLLVAIANVAGLSLARGVGRIPELALRATLGASRARVARLPLIESLTIAALAGAIGLWLAGLGTVVVRASSLADAARLQDFALDGRAMAWTLGATLLAGVLIGLAPMAMVAGRDLRAAASLAGRGIAGSGARLRRVFVAAQCAAAMLLLVGAGLLVRSWLNVLRVDSGFATERVVALNVASPASLPESGRAAFFDAVLERVRALPGVSGVGAGSELFVGVVGDLPVSAPGTDRAEPRPLQLRSDEIAGGFFQTLGVPIVRGRTFVPGDGLGERVAIVNETMARRIWGSADPVGRRFAIGDATDPAASFTVVGVAGDMRRQSVETAPIPQMFEPIAQNPTRRAVVVVRTSTDDPAALIASLRAAVRDVSSDAIAEGTTVEARIAEQQAWRRWQTLLLGVASLASLLLAAVGLYGLMHYSVSTRVQEIGVRMALGARAGDVFRMVVREGLSLSLIGSLAGLVGALWLARVASSLLFGVGAADVSTYVAVSLLVVAAAASACYLPARRAMRIAPIEALRQRVG